MIALAWRNLWRQPRRTIMTVLAIAFASLIMVALLALQVGTYAVMRENTMRLFDGYAQVQMPGYLDNPGIRKSFAGAGALAEKIEKLPGVGTVAARGETFALVSQGQRSLAVKMVGVQPRRESKVSRIAAMVRTGRYLAGNDSAEIVMGAALARNLALKVGDNVTLLGVDRDGSVAADVLKLVGLFSSGIKALDRQLVEMPLGRFQADFAMKDQVNALVVSGASLSKVTRALPAIGALAQARGLVARGWSQLEPGLSDAIRLDASTSLLWYGALIVVVVAILLNTILMSILERTREFGLLLALGMRPNAVGRMVWLEIVMLLALGLGIGISLGGAVAGWFSVHGLALPGTDGVFAQWGLPGLMYTKVTAFSLLAGPGAIAALTLLAGIFPFVRLHRLEPVPAMRAT